MNGAVFRYSPAQLVGRLRQKLSSSRARISYIADPEDKRVLLPHRQCAIAVLNASGPEYANRFIDPSFESLQAVPHSMSQKWAALYVKFQRGSRFRFSAVCCHPTSNEMVLPFTHLVIHLFNQICAAAIGQKFRYRLDCHPSP